jgi:murein DD-endopeptidase MepM/ murein hydrolase activator NlpD
MPRSILVSLIVFVITGCAPTPYIKPALPPAGMPGTYHRVVKGETLWRISKNYNAELDAVANANHITDFSRIEPGQMIFIPDAVKKSARVYSGPLEDFIWPLRGRVVSSFGQTSGNVLNKGINIQPSSDYNVVASRGGKIVFYGENFGIFGKTLIIDHGDGLSTVYSGSSQVFIKAGDSVQKGTLIAKVSPQASYKNSYLHFEIRKGHNPQNPLFYLP